MIISQFWNRKHTFFLLICILTFLCTACGESAKSGTASPGIKPTPSPQPTQPVSAQALLSGPVTYVALGASDAVGMGSTKPNTQGYVPRLASRLPKGSQVINLGISGIRLHEALTQELPLALTTSPRLITIWLVTNDFAAGISHDAYMQDLHMLLKELRANTKARIVLANLPDLTRLPAFAGLTDKQKSTMYKEIVRWNTSIERIAQQYTVSVVDLLADQSELTGHPEYISSDGFHPSTQGYERLADAFWEVVARER